MAATARFNRKVAPKASTKTEASVTPAPVSAPKTSIWTRAKTVATKTAAVIAKPFKKVATKIKPAGKTTFVRGGKIYTGAKARIVRAASKVQVTAKRIVTKVAPRLSKFWTLALRPLLDAMLITVGIATLAVSAFVAPVTTVLVLLGSALLAFAVGFGLKALETRAASMSLRGRRIASIVLDIIEGVAQCARVLAYAGTAVLVVATCSVSLPFALFVVIDMSLSYFEVRGATTIAFLTWCVASGNWAFGLLWLMWRGLRGGTISARNVPEYSEIRRPSVEASDVVMRPSPLERLANERLRKGMSVRPSDAPNNPETWTRGNFLRATGTEELWGTEFDVPPAEFVVHDDADEGRAVPVQNDKHCSACGTDQGSLRVRSANVPFTTAGGGQGTPREDQPRGWLCSTCFDLECEDVALALTGVSLSKTSVEVRLNKTGIEHSPEHAASLFAQGEFVWLVSGWWRDKNGVQFEREHTCLLNGKVVATVVQDHRRRTVFRATVLGKVIDTGVTKTLEGAKYAAQSDLNNELNAVDRHVEAAEAAVANSPRRQAKKV